MVKPRFRERKTLRDEHSFWIFFLRQLSLPKLVAKRLKNLADLSTDSWDWGHYNCIQVLPRSRSPSKQPGLSFGTLSQDKPEIENLTQGLKPKIKYFQISVASLVACQKQKLKSSVEEDTSSRASCCY